jgi:hypothetical protein
MTTTAWDATRPLRKRPANMSRRDWKRWFRAVIRQKWSKL